MKQGVLQAEKLGRGEKMTGLDHSYIKSYLVGWRYSKAMCKCRRRSVFLVGAMAPAPLEELAAVWGRHTAPSPMYGRFGNFCRYIVNIPMHRARSKCQSRVRVLAPTTEQVPVFFRESVYRPYNAVSGLYRLALPLGPRNMPFSTVFCCPF